MTTIVGYVDYYGLDTYLINHEGNLFLKTIFEGHEYRAKSHYNFIDYENIGIAKSMVGYHVVQANNKKMKLCNKPSIEFSTQLFTIYLRDNTINDQGYMFTHKGYLVFGKPDEEYIDKIHYSAIKKIAHRFQRGKTVGEEEILDEISGDLVLYPSTAAIKREIDWRADRDK